MDRRTDPAPPGTSSWLLLLGGLLTGIALLALVGRTAALPDELVQAGNGVDGVLPMLGALLIAATGLAFVALARVQQRARRDRGARPAAADPDLPTDAP